MSSSRRYEVQKKKLAVRRLSQSARANLPIPQGDGRFKFKTKSSHEDFADRKKRLGAGRDGSTKLIRNDLRNKLSTRSDGNQREIRPLMPKRDFQFPLSDTSTAPVVSKPLAPNDFSEAVASNNPFAAAIAAKTSSTSMFQNVRELIPTTEQKEPVLHEAPGLFSVMGDQIKSPPLPMTKGNPFSLGKVNENSFALAKINAPSAPIKQEPISKPVANTASQPAISGAPPQGLNPFAAALQMFSKPSTTTTDVFAPVAVRRDETHAESTENAATQPTVPAPSSTSSIFTGDASLIMELTSLKLMGIPPELNNRDFLRTYYSQFGDLKRVHSNPGAMSAIVTFLNHDDAAEAKRNGTLLREGAQPVNIFWCKPRTVKPKAADEESLATEIPVMPKAVETNEVKKSNKNTQLRKDALYKTVTDFVNSLRMQVARDPNEKAEFLEKIDQKIREGMKKETDIKKASQVIGTCPDMCPEKERYLREHQQRLAIYEVKTGMDSHEPMSGQCPYADSLKTVKEYSRSSADQEEPLPHELRPGHVLQLSMNYLMLNVMDAGDKNIADWYDFVWNRTRAIRKDITQQHFCDESSVDLIEKCARFHIFCSHHLCEENINVFDPKINHENLTKCLQSLKHMYEDLYIEKGITCSSEAEFRCYQILLNLNNGDILREVTEFRPEVRESNYVKFALEVFKSLNSTNYVRFFRLLNEGSFLAGCIMQGYFIQIRSKGLIIMNKAYGNINKPAPVPLGEIARMFAIDDMDEASEFCEHYGFQLDEGLVYFSKSSYEEPDSSFPPVRNGLIGRKRNCSFGEIVNGGPLPTKLNYSPTSSFDENGIYNGTYHRLAIEGVYKSREEPPEDLTDSTSGHDDYVDGTLQNDDILEVCVGTLEPVVRQEVSRVCTRTMNGVKEAVKAASENAVDILNATIKEELKVLVEACVQDYQLEVLSSALFDDMLESVAGELIRNVAEKELVVLKREAEHEKRMRIFHSATELSRDFLYETIEKELMELSTNLLKTERQERRKKIITTQSAEFCQEILSDFLTRETKNICRQSLSLEISRRKQNLEAIKQQVFARRRRRMFQRWKLQSATRKHIWETLNDFPACSPLRTSSEMIRSLARNTGLASHLPDYVTIDSDVELSVSSVSNLARKRGRHREAVERFHQQLMRDRREMTQPLASEPLFEFMAKSLTETRRHFFSKILVGLPEPTMHSQSRGINTEVLKEKLKMGESSVADPTSCVDNICVLSDATPIGAMSLSISAIAASFRKRLNELRETRELNGITGILFLLDFAEPQTLDIHRARLKDTVSLVAADPPCPLLVIGVNSPPSIDASVLTDRLQLRALENERDISESRVLLLDPSVGGSQLNEELTGHLLYLVSKTPNLPSVQMTSLCGVIEDAMQRYFHDNIYEDRSRRINSDMPPIDARCVVDLYNSILSHVQAICTSEQLKKLSWPSKEIISAGLKGVPDLFWNDERSFVEVDNSISNLTLPHLDKNVDADGDWHEQQHLCLKYLYEILKPGNLDIHPTELISRVEGVINRYLDKWKYRTTDTDFPWPLVLEECINVIISSIHKDQSGFYRSKKVCYFKSEFHKFKLPASWKKNIIRLSRSVLSESVASEYDQRFKKARTSSRNEYIEKSIIEIDNTFSIIEQSMSLSRDHSLDLSGAQPRLDDLLQKHKLLDQSLSSERLALSRLSEKFKIDLESSADIEALGASGTKRKRVEDPAAFKDPKGLVAPNQFDRPSSLCDKTKRPRKSLEDRIEDLFSEVESMRSKHRLDEQRYRDVILT